MSTGTKKNRTANRTAIEAWGDHLRRSGSGISTESKNNTMTGLNKTKTKDMSYASTSHYLRQLMGTEKTKKADSGPGQHNFAFELRNSKWVIQEVYTGFLIK